MKISAIRGMRDLLPADTIWFQRLESAAREVFARFNFEEIRTPVLEPKELFARSVGEETDIVSKEMYAFEDRDGAWLTLRPEATASTVRAYVEHRMWDRPGLTKLYYMGPMFRRERPQKGRYRQFYQIGAEVMGGDAPQIDFELLALLQQLLDLCGIKGAELVLNSVGCKECRPVYYKALREALAPSLSGMCVDCQRRASTNPLRVFDCKVEADQPVIEKLPAMTDYLDAACREHFGEVQALLKANGIAYRLNPRLVRGLDYYMRTAFEFVHGALGAQNALLGGGRYDGLAQELGAPASAGGAIGFALGEDRFVLAMQAASSGAAGEQGPDFYLIPIGASEQIETLRWAEKLRRLGARVEAGLPGRKLGKAMEAAARARARYAMLVGTEETAARRWKLKKLDDSSQQTLDDQGLLQVAESVVRNAGGG